MSVILSNTAINYLYYITAKTEDDKTAQFAEKVAGKRR